MHASTYVFLFFLCIFNLNVKFVIILGEIPRHLFSTFFPAKIVIPLVGPIPGHNNKKVSKLMLLSIYLCYIFDKMKANWNFFIGSIQVWPRCSVIGQVSGNRANNLITKPDGTTTFFFEFQLSNLYPSNCRTHIYNVCLCI